MALPFDFDAYRDAFEARDVPAWLDFYADAEWIEFERLELHRRGTQFERQLTACQAHRLWLPQH